MEEGLGEGGVDRQRIQSGLCADSSENDVELGLMSHEIVTRAQVGCPAN